MSRRIALDGRVLDDRYPGIGRYVYNLARALAEAEPDEQILLLTSTDVSSSRFDIGRLVDLGIRTVDIGPLRSARAELALAGRLRELEVDLFHSTYFVLGFGLGCPRVATIYDLIPAKSPSFRSPVGRGLWHLAIRRAQGASRLLTLSQAVKSDLVARGVAAAKITITPAAADPLFLAASELGAADRSRLELPESYVLWVGTNKPHKNLESLVAAWSVVERSDPELWLVGVGSVDGRYPSLQELAAHGGLSRIRSLGVLEDDHLAATYRAAKCLVQPSLHEGLGFPVLEAQACGSPVVCADIPALREVGGDQARYFDPLDAEEMAAAILSTVNTANRRPAKAPESGADLGWEHTARLTLGVYGDVLNAASP